MVTVLSFIAFCIADLLLGWVVWFLIEFIRYIASGEYEIDQRLRNLNK